MPGERLSMRKIRELLRLRWEQHLPQRVIANSLRLSQASVSDYLSRARRAGLTWPLPDALDDAGLEALLFPPLPDVPSDQRPVPDWSAVHRDLRRPNVTLALEAGIACANGIQIDDDARTSDPDIFAIGDCTNRPLAHYARSARLESVHNAVETAKLAAAAIAGKPRPVCDVPWFWSDQYDLKLQTVGLLEGYDEAIVRGDPAARRFAVWYLKDRTLLAIDAVNSMPDFLCGKKLVGSGAKLDLDALRDPATDLGKFAAADKDAPRWGRNHLRWGEALARLGRADQARAQWRAAADLSSADQAKLRRLLKAG